MPVGQAIFLAILGAIFLSLVVYVFVVRPRRRRRLPPVRRPERPERELPEREEPAEPEPEPEALAPEEPEPVPEAEARQRDAEARRREAEDRRREAEDRRRGPADEAEFRRREADARRRRAEAERREREERLAAERREQAERRRKADEEVRRRREEEERRKAEEEAKRRAEEEAKRQAEEEAARQRTEEAARKRDRLRRLKEGLGKTRDEGFVGKLGTLFGKKALDDELLGDLEEIMLTADIGVKTADALFHRVKEGLTRNELQDPAAVFRCLKEEARRILAVGKPPPRPESVGKPYVVMMVGVNGSGKTTTIGKLAAQYRARGMEVTLAAGDTFRAAAAEQLAVWATRTRSTLVRGQEGSDPSSVIFNAIKEGQAKGADVVICDTAGRLQTKAPLMEELKKIRRVIGKAAEGAPHEVLLVLDATNGQNAISQAKLFNEAMELSGIVLTKLDGTAKGGVILGISDELGIPVRYIGIGESVEDLREFNPDDFLEALFEIRDEAA